MSDDLNNPPLNYWYIGNSKFNLENGVYRLSKQIKRVFETRNPGNREVLIIPWLRGEEKFLAVMDSLYVGIICYENSSGVIDDIAKKILCEGERMDELEVSTTGRMTLPKELTDLVGIHKKGIAAGMKNYFELWNPEKYRRNMEKARVRI